MTIKVKNARPYNKGNTLKQELTYSFSVILMAKGAKNIQTPMDLYPLFEVQNFLKLIGSNSWSPTIRIQQPPFLSGLCGTVSLTTCKVREPKGLVVKSFAQIWTMFWCMLIGFLRGAVIPLMFRKVPQSSLGILRAPFLYPLPLNTPP